MLPSTLDPRPKPRLFFNIRMLLGLRKENRYLTPWVICQFVFQVTILVAVTVDTWNKHVDENYEYCCLLKELQKTAVFLVVCNFAQLEAVSLDKPEHPLKQKIRTASPLKLVSATLGMKLWPLQSRGTQREYSSKPLKHSIVKGILVFKQ